MPETSIHETARVDPSATIGSGTRIWEWSKVRENACVGSCCVIGQGVYIDHGVIVGDRCKIQNGVSLYAGVELGSDVFVGPYATFTNDRLPRAFSTSWEIVPTAVFDGASIGANATIVCGVTLGAYCMVGAGAVVTTNVPLHALVVGNPARPIDFVTRSGKRMHWDMTQDPPEDFPD